ncbi:hypothetical protein D3870_04355 [Noviherbaspirillum cavernae]|uniref:Uncharacterized protein n=1 Tax=Noviherbaspirillum cavernae TaxID=2320862 RepID=A0A418WZ30_9BURK|nr:hypothetical protein [Noviherbaspirillum cavernae]RJG05353.1 hypothetical protein D3870_04355 [Noviherbaspirillum cavernae]
MVAPADVESGLYCGCTCVGCGARLIAKKGAKLAWHFAHHVVLASQSCVETAVHAAAKQVLLENNWLQVPEKVVTVIGRTKFGTSPSKSRMLSPARVIRFDYSRDEVWEAGSSLRPDVVGYRGTRRLLVEICFRHEVDEVKRRKLVSLGLPAVEIDLSDLPFDTDFAAIRERVLDNLSHKEWLFYPNQEEAAAELHLEIQKEVETLNRAYDSRDAAQRQKDEARQREKERVRQAIADANEQYRLLPSTEKERLVREKLGIKGTWPYFLNKPSPESNAIAAPAYIWQATLFARFVLGKADSDSRIDVDTLVDWVTGRCGQVDNRSTDAVTAVRKFLAYLSACGFLEKSPYDPYGRPYYKVVHDGLNPPPRQSNREQAPNSAPIYRKAVSFRKPGAEPANRKPHWLWRASWPARQEMLEASEKLLSSSPYKGVLGNIARTLTRGNCPAEPVILANRLGTQGVPPETTLDFLVELGLALRAFRPA